jgi:hypothetical protein
MIMGMYPAYKLYDLHDVRIHCENLWQEDVDGKISCGDPKPQVVGERDRNRL